MNRPAPISVFSDQRRTKSTIWSRVSCGTQTPVRVPQIFFLGPHVPPSVRPNPHPSFGSSSPDGRFVLPAVEHRRLKPQLVAQIRDRHSFHQMPPQNGDLFFRRVVLPLLLHVFAPLS